MEDSKNGDYSKKGFHMKSVPPSPFKRKGIRIHDPAAGSIGGLTPDQQAKSANQTAIETDPVLGANATPQNRIARYGGGGFNGQA